MCLPVRQTHEGHPHSELFGFSVTTKAYHNFRFLSISQFPSADCGKKVRSGIGDFSRGSLIVCNSRGFYDIALNLTTIGMIKEFSLKFPIIIITYSAEDCNTKIGNKVQKTIRLATRSRTTQRKIFNSCARHSEIVKLSATVFEI